MHVCIYTQQSFPQHYHQLEEVIMDESLRCNSLPCRKPLQAEGEFGLVRAEIKKCWVLRFPIFDLLSQAELFRHLVLISFALIVQQPYFKEGEFAPHVIHH